MEVAYLCFLELFPKERVLCGRGLEKVAMVFLVVSEFSFGVIGYLSIQ